MRRSFVVAAIMCLFGLAAMAAEMRLEQSPLYGQVAILSEGPVRLDVALTEGCRLVSWQLAGQEILYAGRSWGGDAYDRYQVGEQSGDTRRLPPVAVDALRQDGLVALRARFQLPGGATLQRIIALSAEGLFIESSFSGGQGPWYEFAVHLARSKALPLAVIYPEGDKLSSRPLQPGENYGGLPAALAVTGWRDGWSLIWHCGEGMSFHPRVWGDNLSFGLAGTYGGTPLRVSCQWRQGDIAEDSALPSAPPCSDCAGDWSPLSFTVAEQPRAEVCAIARDFGFYGVCNSDPNYMAPLAAAGIRWVRMGNFSWSACEGNAGQRDFSAADAALAAAEKEGMAVIATFSGTPAWAGMDGSRTAVPKDWQQWREHVAQTVASFRERVHVWEIWNEPDIRQFWKGSVEDYVQLLRVAYQAAKEADPACLVMSAGLDGMGESYFVRMLALGAADAFDLVGFHPYANHVGGAEHRLRMMQRIMAYHGINRPMWITEVGWQSGGWKGGPGVVASEEIKAARLSEAYQRLSAYADVVCWYTGVEPGQMYGLLQPVGTRGFVLTPAWFALRELAMPASSDLRIEAPEQVTLRAGEDNALPATIHGQQPMQVRWLGMEPEWALNAGDTPMSGKTHDATLRLRLPAHLRPGSRHLLLSVQNQQGRHIASHAVAINIENSGSYCELKLSGDWIRRLDQEGKGVGNWTPASNLALKAGEGFMQPVRPANQGNTDERLALTLSGSAAAWFEPQAESVAVPAGKRGWVGLRARVPADTPTGTYTLNVLIQSTTFPDVRAEWQGSYSIVHPKDAKANP
ncbi:MAG: hypothetical protein GX945_04345 [Lentisphaerae bacterium]|nr:hypothetical protein [Lentisphaerota bacterium]